MKPSSRIVLLKPCLACLLVLAAAGCRPQSSGWDTKAGVLVNPSADAGVPEAIKAVEAAVPRRVMQGSGLAGAMGEVNLKAQRSGTYDMQLPLPQLVDNQTPVFYCLNSKPKASLTSCRLQVQRDGNAFVSLKLDVEKNQEVTVEWSSVVLISPRVILKDHSAPKAFSAASPCAQADNPRIVELAGRLWPPRGTTRNFASNIQEYIRTMKRQNQPMSLDAVGILESGQNTICTANANLACALMRARHIPCRSIATLPTLSHRFEMHRIVEYFDNSTWVSFDPSRVYPDIPLKPWHNVIMRKTSVADEQTSMKPRLGAMRGCPFGQEAEFNRPGLNLFGQAFFWTIAVPLAEFEVTEEAARLTADHWKRYLETGTLDAAQLKAARTRDIGQYLGAMKNK